MRPSGDCWYFMSVTRTSGIMPTVRVTSPLMTISRLLVSTNRSLYQSATRHPTQLMMPSQTSTATVTIPL